MLLRKWSLADKRTRTPPTLCDCDAAEENDAPDIMEEDDAAEEDDAPDIITFIRVTLSFRGLRIKYSAESQSRAAEESPIPGTNI